MSLVALIYTSRPAQPMGAVELGHLLLQARLFNAQVQVTGVLLHDPTQFLQYIEGPAESIDTVYRRICASDRHQEVVKLMHEPIAERLFPDWQMGFAETAASMLQKLANHHWSEALSDAERRQPDAPALRLLRSFWAAGARPAPSAAA